MFFNQNKKLAQLMTQAQKEADRQLGMTKMTRTCISNDGNGSSFSWEATIDNCHYHDGDGKESSIFAIGETPIHALEKVIDELGHVRLYSKLRPGKCNDKCKKQIVFVPTP